MPKKNSEPNLKKTILKYLQANALTIHKTINGLVDARFEDDPPRLVLSVTHEMEKPVIKYRDVELPIEIEVAGAPPVIVVENKGEIAPEAERKENSEFSDQAIDMYNIKDAINPHVNKSDTQSKGALREKAFEAWRKRHRHVKIA